MRLQINESMHHLSISNLLQSVFLYQFDIFRCMFEHRLQAGALVELHHSILTWNENVARKKNKEDLQRRIFDELGIESKQGRGRGVCSGDISGGSLRGFSMCAWFSILACIVRKLFVDRVYGLEKQR